MVFHRKGILMSRFNYRVREVPKHPQAVESLLKKQGEAGFEPMFYTDTTTERKGAVVPGLLIIFANMYNQQEQVNESAANVIAALKEMQNAEGSADSSNG